MRANFIKMLCENEIKSTEMALATENIGNELQSMVEKLTNIKTKDLAELVKKIKFDNDIEAGESFNQSMSEKLDQAIQTLTEIRNNRRAIKLIITLKKTSNFKKLYEENEKFKKEKELEREKEAKEKTQKK